MALLIGCIIRAVPRTRVLTFRAKYLSRPEIPSNDLLQTCILLLVLQMINSLNGFQGEKSLSVANSENNPIIYCPAMLDDFAANDECCPNLLYFTFKQTGHSPGWTQSFVLHCVEQKGTRNDLDYFWTYSNISISISPSGMSCPLYGVNLRLTSYSIC